MRMRLPLLAAIALVLAACAVPPPRAGTAPPPAPASPPAGQPSPPAPASSTQVDQIKTGFANELRAFDREQPRALPCVEGFHVVRGYVAHVAAWAQRAGLQRGDRVVEINGVSTETPAGVARGWAENRGSRFVLTVQRPPRLVPVVLPCTSGIDRWSTTRALLQAGADGQWEACEQHARRLPAIMGFTSSRMLGYRLRCRIGSRQISAGEHQQGQYDVARLLIAEASVAPAALDAVRGTVLNIIGALRNAYAHTLAEDLDRQLSDAIRAAREAPVIRGTSLGTGFVVRPNGVLLTAHHVVRGAKTITVKCLDRPATEATLVAAVPNNDLAVLRLASAADLPYLPVAPPRSARVGDHVFTVGFPASGILGHEAKFTEGSISAMSGPGGEATFMQISVPIQPGNSGGPLVSESGEVVGVVTATAAVEAFLAATGSLPQNVNFAVKGEYTLPLFEEPARVSPPAGRRDAIDRALRATCAIEAKP